MGFLEQAGPSAERSRLGIGWPVCVLTMALVTNCGESQSPGGSAAGGAGTGASSGTSTSAGGSESGIGGSTTGGEAGAAQGGTAMGGGTATGGTGGGGRGGAQGGGGFASGSGGSDDGAGGAIGEAGMPGTGGGGAMNGVGGTGGDHGGFSGAGGDQAGSGGTGGDQGGSGGTGGEPLHPDIVWAYTGPLNSFARAVTIDANSTIHVAGYHAPEGTRRGWHLRLDTNGSTVGDDIDPDEKSTQYANVVQDGQGNLYFAGTVQNPSSQAYLRRRNADLSFGWQVTHTFPGGSSYDGLALDSQGRIVTVGRRYNNDAHAILYRYTADGVNDFSDTHTSPWDVYNAVAIDAADNLYAVGRQEIRTGSVVIGSNAALTRYGASGGGYTVTINRKPTCSQEGSYTNGYAVTVGPDGNVWVAGNHCDGENILRKLNAANGALLTTADFTTPGAATDTPFGMGSDGSGITIVGRWTYDANEPAAFALMDTDADGTPTRTLYYSPGGSLASLQDVAFFPNGDRLVVGGFRATSTADRAWVARLRAP